MQTSVYAAGDEEDDCVEESVYESVDCVYESVDVVERVRTRTSTLPGTYRCRTGAVEAVSRPFTDLKWWK